MKKIILDVKFDEKEVAKRRGAKWDANTKKWYVVDPSMWDLLSLFSYLSREMKNDLITAIPDSSSYLSGLYGEDIDILPTANLNSTKVKSMTSDEIDRVNAALQTQAEADRYAGLDAQSRVIKKRYS